MVVERMANEIRMVSVSRVTWRSKLEGSMEKQTSRGRSKEVSSVVGDLGLLLKDKKSVWQNNCKESMKSEQEVLVYGGRTKAQANVKKKLLEDFQDRKKQQEDDMWK